MDKEVLKYLENMTNLLNGQLRGAINLKAREENKELITLTIADVFQNAYTIGVNEQSQKNALRKLKNDLNSTEDDDNRLEG